ncbi:MAG: thioredoxin family protein, partial [Bacteroidota bacterium]
MPIQSIDIPLGTAMPTFKLNDPDGKQYAGDRLYGQQGLLVVFTCNHCPYAKAVWPRTIKLAEYAKGLGINTVGINPNIHPDYPEDAPEVMKQRIADWGITFPYLIDDTQQIAAAFKAQCTPDIYLFNRERKLVYHGRVDDDWQDESSVKREELKEAIQNLAAGKPLAEA